MLYIGDTLMKDVVVSGFDNQSGNYNQTLLSCQNCDKSKTDPFQRLVI